jgi:predicted adenine nucleotide alpha hydrolase (AANH) superfamily ATPase
MKYLILSVLLSSVAMARSYDYYNPNTDPSNDYIYRQIEERRAQERQELEDVQQSARDFRDQQLIQELDRTRRQDNEFHYDGAY